MPPVDLLPLLPAFAIAFVAGAVNSIAGGGTMMAFPTLIALGLPPLTANATCTVGLWPGTVGSMMGFCKIITQLRKRYYWLILPSLIGGGLGAWILRSTPASTFDHLIPWLLLFATTLFVLQRPLQAKLARNPIEKLPRASWLVFAAPIQFLIAVYGGYFGAGISIMMMAVLGLIGQRDMFKLNATCNMLSCSINGVAGFFFICTGMVHWPTALVMMLGSLAGGFTGSRAAQHIGRPLVRKFVIGIGLIMVVALFIRLKLIHGWHF